MYIPKQMIKQIAKVFYDKEVYLLDKRITIDAEGGVNTKGYEVVGSFKGNVNFSNCKQIQEEYGLDYNIDVAVTTSKDTVIKMDDIISYDNIVFKITDVLPSDSHLLVVATKWRQ